MYNYLNGSITVINPKYIVIDVAGVGYEVYVSNPYSYNLSNKINLYVYQHVKEDSLTLYGFKTIEEKELFLDLISVKGIGPKTALVILAATSINEFKNAINTEDIAYLTKFPKIGKKSAQQMIIDLESKYTNMELQTDSLVDNTNDEVVEALQALGYDKKAITNILKKIEVNLTTEEKVKEGLKLLIKI